MLPGIKPSSALFFWVCFLLAASGMSGGNELTSMVQIDRSPTPNAFNYPDPIVLQIRLHGPQPIANARVAADVTAPSGKQTSVIFRETGGYGPYDVRYAAAIHPPLPDGVYTIDVYADDNDGQAFIAGARNSEPRPGRETESYSTAAPGFTVNKTFTVDICGYQSKGMNLPSRIIDLHAKAIKHRCFRLSWTVPIDIQPGAKYEIRIYRQPLNSESAWEAAESVAVRQYSAKGGGIQQEELCFHDRGRFYIGVRSRSMNSLASDLSNDYAVEIQ